ncbi:TPA: RNA-directed DNA polymerase [Vibrio parahaemolyticus]|nr:RNA-directed DNA polymerase [Vibrio parahaemolyticus]
MNLFVKLYQRFVAIWSKKPKRPKETPKPTAPENLNIEMLGSMLSKGYFPKEALPCFSTEKYSKSIIDNYSNLPELYFKNKYISKCGVHNIARKGTLRRKLGIPNPINYFRLSNEITKNWLEISKVVSKSHLSLTTPMTAVGGNRAFERKHSLNELPELQSKLRSRYKYLLKTDISRFYHSVYTHSIAWTYHSKGSAKGNRSNSLFGNAIDKAFQDSQDGQTVGIPIGPDASLVIAESILSRVDEKLKSHNIDSGLRYIDDYYLGFNTLGEAESALTLMQETLNEYELALNPLKTEIIKLPIEFEPIEISKMRAFNFSPLSSSQKTDLIYYFNIAFVAAKNLPSEPILKYAVSRTHNLDISESNYPIFENFILQCAISDSSTLPFITEQLIKYKRKGYKLDLDNISYVLKELAMVESSLGHGNEVAHCLWLHLVLQLPLSEDVFKNAILMRDSFVAILLHDCFKKNLCNYNCDFSHYESLMNKDELQGDMWLFVYESLARKWFKPTGKQNPIKQNECFNHMLKSNVFFYDESKSNTVMTGDNNPEDVTLGGFSG